MPDFLRDYFRRVWIAYLQMFWFVTRIGWVVTWFGAAYYLAFQPSPQLLLIQPEHERGFMFLCIVALIAVPWALWSSRNVRFGT